MLEEINSYLNKIELSGLRFRKKIGSFKRIKKKAIMDIFEYPRAVKVDDHYYRLYHLNTPPLFFDPSTIFRLINLDIPLYVSYRIHPMSRHIVLDKLKARFSVLESTQNGRIMRGKNIDLGIKKEMNDALQFINKIINENETAMDLDLGIGIKGDSISEINSIHNKITTIFKDLELPFNISTFDQVRNLNNLLPISSKVINPLTVSGNDLSCFLPFVSKRIYDGNGFFLGVDGLTKELVIIDIFKYRNANINIFGVSGSGKSVLSKLIITRSLIRGIRSIILDPEGEYSSLINSYKGTIYKLGDNSGIDPIELILGLNTAINTKVNILINFFDFFIRTENKDTNKLDKLIISYIENNDEYSFKSFINFLNRSKKSNRFVSDIDWLYRGSLSNIFKRTNKIELINDLISFDFSSLHTEKERIPIIYLITSYIKLYLNNNKRKRLIIIDEAHKLLLNDVTTSLYIDLVKTARKRNAGIISITQNPEDYKQSNLSRTILTQAELTFVLKQSPSSLNYIKRYSLFDLPNELFKQISNLGVGQALLIKEQENLLIDIIPFDNEKDYVFT